ncbi:MAG: PQQ-binding-like beta-propeller repeat protein [Gammaproteobacteria bacterium]|nr:PQQ-binding-like beta-propeller repeat protein [Gammaproteobacteria bacterium]
MQNKFHISIRLRFLLALLTIFFAPVTSAALCELANSFDPGSSDANTWSGWGGTHSNNRFNKASNNPINSQSLSKLTLKWAYGFEDVRSVIGNPALQGNRIFIGDENGKVYSLDRESACEDWIFSADNGVRTTPLLEQINDRWLLFFGDRSANVYAVDAITGQQVWKVKVEQHQAAIITGAPQYIQLDNESAPHRIIIPVSSSEEGLGAVPAYACCSFQGSVVSLDASNGDIVWKTSTIQEAVRETIEGKFGPSGAAIWSAPTIDLELNQLYVTTGDAYSAPADSATDAVIAMDLLNGNILWTRQGTPDDIWTVICMTPNAFPECGPDQDFGSPGILVSANNQAFLVAGQKSGIVRAYERASGNILWQTALVENTTEFGGKIVWGGASDEQKSYWGMGNNEINAVKLSDGSMQWSRSIPPVEGMEAHPGLEGPLTISHDVLFSGSWDGMLRALSTNTGELLWEDNTARPFDTINNTPANGGSMGAVGQVVEDGLLLVTSGYIGVKNGVQGNVLLVFEIK